MEKHENSIRLSKVPAGCGLIFIETRFITSYESNIFFANGKEEHKHSKKCSLFSQSGF
jgi:hypothetical protein